MKRRLEYCFFLIFALWHSVLVQPVSGDDGPLFQEKSSRNNAATSEIIEPIRVTARKMEENIQKIPMSISAFSDIQIEDAGIGDVENLILLTPNVHMKSGASSNILIFRGISNDADFIHSPASLYVDDVCYTMNFMHNPDLLDIERIEILRGPQGTLYGRNSESGVINIITLQPGDTFMGKISGEFALYDPDHGTSPSYRTGLSLSGPVVAEKLYMGFSGQVEISDGFMKNIKTGNDDAGEVDHKNARLTTRWTPSDQLEISTILDVLETDDGNGNKRYLEGPWATSPHEINYDTDNNINEQEANGQSLKIKYTGAAFNVLSITGRRYYENDMLRDSRCSPVDDGINDLTYSSDMISEEVRITSRDDANGFSWLGGVYLFTEKNETDIDMPTWREIRNTDMETRGYAIFGQGTVSLYRRLHLTAGLRYSYDDLEGEMDYSGIDGKRFFEKSFDNEVVLPKFSVSYDLTPQILAYATVSRGYYSGGYNSSSAMGPETFAYDPEYTWNHELGLKSAWLNNRLTLNLAVFHIEIDDKQVPQYDGETDVMEVKNAAEAHSRGFEVEVHAKPLRTLDIFAGVGYTDVEFDDWVATERVSPPGKPPAYADYDYAGKKFPNAPEYTANLGIQYRHDAGFFGRADLVLSDEFYSDAKNTQNIDGKTLVNLRAGYEGEGIDIIFWCRNLFNEDYQTIGFARKFDQTVDGEPRMFGVTATYHF